MLIVLAAGASERMGVPKALLKANRASFLATLATTAARARLELMVVVSPSGQAIQEAHPALRYAVNLRPELGQMSSALLGLKAALRLKATHVLVQPVDAPLVKASTIQAVLRGLEHAPCAVARHRGRSGHPVGFTAAAAHAVARCGAATLEQALAELPTRVVDVDDAGATDNINTPRAYRRRFGTAPRIASPGRR